MKLPVAVKNKFFYFEFKRSPMPGYKTLKGSKFDFYCIKEFSGGRTL
jgi:hypothetical protein